MTAITDPAACRIFAYRSFNPELATVKRFADFGVDTICLLFSHTYNSLGLPYSSYPPIWTDPDTYDFDALDAQLDDQLSANPNAKFLCFIDLNTPVWWVRKWHRYDSFAELGKVAADDTWRTDTAAYLTAFLEHTEAHYRDHMAMVFLGCGGTTEWIDDSFGEESPSRIAAWRQYCIDAGRPDPIDLPPVRIRESCHGDLLRDPVLDAAAIDYWRFHNAQISDAILFFARTAQTVLKHRIPLGVPYGYLMYHMEHGLRRIAAMGHLDAWGVFTSPDIDAVFAPATYMNRRMGDATGSQCPTASIRRLGKIFLQELDHRTHTASPPKPSYTHSFNLWANDTETIAGLRREFAWCLINGTGLWWFDMWGRWYDTPAVQGALADMKHLWDRLIPCNPTPDNPIALVLDAESCYFLNPDHTAFETFMRDFRQHLSRIGTGHDVVTFDDLAHGDLDAYRLIIFPNCFTMDPARRAILDRHVFTNDRTVLWFGPSGVITNGTHDDTHIEQLTGIGPDIPVWSPHDMGTWTSVHSPQFTSSIADLRTVAANAGVHLYTHSDQVTWASESLLAHHTAVSGPVTFTLPRRWKTITELLGNRLIATDTDTFTDTLAAPTTVLYHLED